MVVRPDDHPGRVSGRKLDRFCESTPGVWTGWTARLPLYTSPRAATRWIHQGVDPGIFAHHTQTIVLPNTDRLVSPMRELERDPLPSPLNATPLVVVGRGRVGRSFATAAAQAGIEVRLVAHHEAVESIPPEAAVLLCVPDRAIAELSSQLSAPAPALIGHVSGGTTLEALAPATA